MSANGCQKVVMTADVPRSPRLIRDRGVVGGLARMDEAAHHPRVASNAEREELHMGQLDAVLGNAATRRTFLKGTGVLAASGILAACRKNVDESGAGGAAPS